MDSPQPAPGLLMARIGGVPVYLARGFVVIPLVLVVVFGAQVARIFPGLGASAYLVAAAFAVLFFLTVLAHELSHALAGRLLGQQARQIVVNLWGGHTEFTRAAAAPWRMIPVSLAGPVCNGLIGLAALALATSGNLGPVAGFVSYAFALVNIVLAVFNLLPGLPLDGGRVVEAVVWQATGRRWKGTLAAGWMGRGVAALTVVWFLRPLLRGERPDVFSVIWALLIAAMLWQAAGAAISHARVRSRAQDLDLRALMEPALAVPAGTTLGAVRHAMAEGGHSRAAVVVVGPQGPLGLLDPEAVSHVPPDRVETAPVEALSRRIDPHDVLDVDLTADALFEALAELRSGRFVVVQGPERAVVGVVPAAQLVAVLMAD